LKTRTVARTSVLLALVAIVGVAIYVAPGGPVRADLPYCSAINCYAKPCDKRCLNDSGYQITCGEYIGNPCDVTPPTPTPAPELCASPAISAMPNPASVNNPVTLTVSNSSNNLLPHSFVWSFGDGVHSSASLRVQKTYGEPGTYNVYWEGWANCPEGHRFVSTNLSLAVYGPGPTPSPGDCNRPQGTKPRRPGGPNNPTPPPC
jgi:PKD domain